MQFTKDTQHLFRTEADRAMPARVKPVCTGAHDLNTGRGTNSRKHSLSIGRDVLDILGAV